MTTPYVTLPVPPPDLKGHGMTLKKNSRTVATRIIAMRAMTMRLLFIFLPVLADGVGGGGGGGGRADLNKCVFVFFTLSFEY
jgi:hypothetical protein